MMSPTAYRHDAERPGRSPTSSTKPSPGGVSHSPRAFEGLQDDAALQPATSGFSPQLGLNFEGIGDGQYGFTVEYAPPDTVGAVGATQYVQWVNA